MILNNRELALVIWSGLIVGAAMMNAGTRQALGNLLRAFIHNRILLSLAAAGLWIAACVLLLGLVGVWRSENLKTTVVWTLTFAFITVLSINRITEDSTFFDRTLRETLSGAAIVTFVAEFYTFSLPAEMLWGFWLAALAGLYTTARHNPENARAERLLFRCLVVSGTVYLGAGIYQTAQNLDTFTTVETLREFAVPTLLTALFLPFVFFLGVYATYEMRFLTIGLVFTDPRLRTLAKWRAVMSFGLNLDLLRRWVREIQLRSPADQAALERSIADVKATKKRERRPSAVDPLKGWSPMEARDFLTTEGFLTNDYHKSFNDEWIASSPMIEVGHGLFPDNIAYYIEGDEEAAKQLKLKLNVNNPQHPSLSLQRFKELGSALIRAAVPQDNTALDSFLAQNTLDIVKGGRRIRVTRDDDGREGRYSVRLIIEQSF